MTWTLSVSLLRVILCNMQKLFAIRAFEATDRLERFSKSGRVVPEINREDIREIILGHYRIIYRIITEEVEILTVHHGANPLEFSNL